jgi:hypothetical protein
LDWNNLAFGAGGGGTLLTGSLTWNKINVSGASGELFGTMLIDIPAGGTYSGSDAFLNNIKRFGGIVELQFASGIQPSADLPTLASLYTSGSYTDTGAPLGFTFSGTITAVPETSTVVAGFGALGLVALIFGRRSQVVQILK